MNKSDLVAAIAEKAEMSKKDAEKALKAFEDVVTEELTNNGKVQWLASAHSMLRKEQRAKAETLRQAKQCLFLHPKHLDSKQARL